MAEDRVVEGSQVEGRAQGRGYFAPQPLDFALARLVGQGLGGPGDVAVGLDRGVGVG